LISNEERLIFNFGKSTEDIFAYWLTASDFLQYANSLYTARVVDKSTARNAVATDKANVSQSLASVVLSSFSGEWESVVSVKIAGLTTRLVFGAWEETSQVINLDVLYADLASGEKTGSPAIIGYSDEAATVQVAQGVVGSVVANHILIENKDDFDSKYLDYVNASDTVQPWLVAKYAGDMGNSLGVAIIDSHSQNVTVGTGTAQIQNVELLAPAITSRNGTSQYAVSRGFTGIEDLIHILIIDLKGRFSGPPGTILERYEFVSKLPDAKNDSNASLYWKTRLNDNSDYVWAIDNPVLYGLRTVT